MILSSLHVPQARNYACLCDCMLSFSGILSTAASIRLLGTVAGTRGLRGAAVLGSFSLLETG